MTYFARICSTKKVQANLEASEGLIKYVTNRGKARVIPIGAGQSSSCQIILNLFGYDIFYKYLQYTKNFGQILRYQRY